MKYFTHAEKKATQYVYLKLNFRPQLLKYANQVTASNRFILRRQSDKRLNGRQKTMKGL